MSDKPKIVLRTPHPVKQKQIALSGAVRVTPEAELVVRELAGMTSLPIRQVASELLIQAANLCEIVRDEARMEHGWVTVKGSGTVVSSVG